MTQSGLPANSPDDESRPPDERPMRSRAISTGPPRLTPFRELQLVEQHRDGDPHALTELLQGYQRRMYAICYRMVRNVDEASDLTQDALVKVIEHLDSYDGRSALSTWIIRITMNCALSHLRKKNVRRAHSLNSHDVRASPAADADDATASALHPIDAREPDAHERIEQQEQREALLRALMRLEPETRAILTLRDMQDLDYEQIGLVIGVPIGTVKSRLFRARVALREAMRAESGRDEA